MQDFLRAFPYLISMVFVPLLAIGAIYGGPYVLLVPVFGFATVAALDLVSGIDQSNRDPSDETGLFWHKAITIIWLPLQVLMIFGVITALSWSDHIEGAARAGLVIGLGIVTGGVGIVYAHELMHQRNRLERFCGEWLMVSVLYGHFMSEHLLVHHVKVATAEDSATARYNESIYAFFARVLPGSLRSAWSAETARLRRRERSVWSFANPFWRYGLGALGFLFVAWLIGGWAGVGWYLMQSIIAVLILESINYVEHYGLTRKYLGGGKYEQVRPKHSWNAGQMFSNYYLINLQRHSDHHFKPDRRYPLLQTYAEEEAPQLPLGYAMMLMLAQNPWAWRRVMNPRVRRWRSMHYPEVTDWSAYRRGVHIG